MRPLYKYNVNGLSHEEAREFLVSNWLEATASTDGRGPKTIVGDENHARVTEWLKGLAPRDAHRVARVFALRRSSPPNSFPEEWNEPFAIWRNAQFALESIERGEDQVVIGQEKAAAAIDWTTIVTPAELSRLLQSGGLNARPDPNATD